MKTRPVWIALLVALISAWSCEDDTDGPVLGDVDPPARVVDLAIDSVSSSTITLTWTAPGDDGANGRASSYTLKRSGSMIDAANFSSSTTVPGLPSPTTAGTTEAFIVTGLDSTIDYYFALRAIDDEGNASPVSNNAAWTPTATPVHYTKTIPSYKDNTLYQEDGLCPTCPGTNGVLDSLSNGAGEYVFIGTNNVSAARRALIAFAIADSLPSNATVDSVVLTLNMSRSISDSVSSSLHRVLAEWGEGTSDASCCLPEEGAGSPATVGDATWAFGLFRSSAWTMPGGDFVVTASATQGIEAIGLYTWQSSQMTADVQGWLDSPATNFGWILLGDESTDRTAKRFDAHETAATGPRLTIYYTVP